MMSKMRVRGLRLDAIRGVTSLSRVVMRLLVRLCLVDTYKTNKLIFLLHKLITYRIDKSASNTATLSIGNDHAFSKGLCQINVKTAKS